MTIFPWTELEPEEEDYLWDCIDTEITEIPELVSLCEWGNFRILARVFWGGFGNIFHSRLRTDFNCQPIIIHDISSDVNAERELAAQGDVVFDISSDITQIGIDRFFTSTSNIIHDILSDGNAERELAAQGDVVFDISDPVISLQVTGIDAYTVLMLHADGDMSDSQHVTLFKTYPNYSSTIKKF